MLRLGVLLTLLTFGLCARAEAKIVCDPFDDGQPPVVLGDIDDDNQADLAVGLPESRQVYVEQTHAGGVTLGSGAHGFGRAVAVGDLDGDHCADVAIGAPLDGQVLIYRGSPGGLTDIPVVINGSGGFGAAVVIAQDSGLWVGAPGAERIERYTLSGAVATSAGSVTARNVVAGERFGAHLAPGRGGVFVGVPRRAHGKGAVEFVPVAGPHRVFTLPHRRRGDRFGAAVATTPDGRTAAAGAPGRDAVQVLGGRVFTGERGSRFGAALVYGRAFSCQERSQVAVLAPGARTVTIVSGQKECRKRYRNVTAVGMVRYRDDFDEDVYDPLALGRPGSVRLRGKTVSLPSTGRQVIAVAESGSAL